MFTRLETIMLMAVRRHSRSEDIPGEQMEQMTHVGTGQRQLREYEDDVGRVAAHRERCGESGESRRTSSV